MSRWAVRVAENKQQLLYRGESTHTHTHISNTHLAQRSILRAIKAVPTFDAAALPPLASAMPSAVQARDPRCARRGERELQLHTLRDVNTAVSLCVAIDAEALAPRAGAVAGARRSACACLLHVARAAAEARVAEAVAVAA